MKKYIKLSVNIYIIFVLWPQRRLIMRLWRTKLRVYIHNNYLIEIIQKIIDKELDNLKIAQKIENDKNSEAKFNVSGCEIFIKMNKVSEFSQIC